MHKFIADVTHHVLFSAEPQVALLVKPDFRWVVVLNENPLADVEFAVADYEGVLDVLLDHELPVFV